MKGAADIEQTAAEWLVRREGEGWSDADRIAFDQWLGEETAHRVAVIRLETVWRKAGRLRVSALSGGEGPTDAVSAELIEDVEIDRHRIRRRWLWPAAIAVSLALISIPIYQVAHRPETYATAVGGFQHLPLADGSRIDLNTNSRISVAYSDRVRRLDLEQGEAFFDVAKNPDRPFVVHVDGYRVTAVGTAFTVRRRGGELDVIVSEGRVRIDAPATAGEKARPAFASAGQTATVAGGASVVRPLGAAAIDQALSWRDGLLIFEDRPLGEVAAEFNRYNRVQLAVDPSATGVIVDGSFRASNVQGFLRLLEQGFDVGSERGGQNELILKKI